MRVITEAHRPQEAEAKREMGEKAYNATKEIVKNLLGTPEFMTALGIRFFGRSFPRGGRPLITEGVYFQKGDFGYKVSYRAEPLHDIHSQNANTGITIEKYNPRLKNEGGVGNKQVGSVRLASHFTEDPDEGIISFDGGSASVTDKSREYEGLSALDKIRDVIGDLSPLSVKL